MSEAIRTTDMQRALARQRVAAIAVWRADVATRLEGDWDDLGGLYVHTTGLGVDHWNGAKLAAPQGMSRLAAAAEWFADHQVPWGLLIPEELDSDHGLELITEQRVMLRSMNDLPPEPADLDLRWDRGEDAAAVQSAAFGDALPLALRFVPPKVVNPASAVVVAYDGSGRPVSTATVFCVGGVAGVFGVGTVADARRQGLGAATTLAVLHEARRRGCDLAYLNPTDIGYSLYASLGFTDAPGWRVYRPPAA